MTYEHLQENKKQVSQRGRRAASRNVRLEPVFRKEPDIQKLGRAIIAMALRNASMGEGDGTGDQYDNRE